MMEKNILLGHGSGGKLMHSLINDLFLKYFKNPLLEQQGDSAILNIEPDKIAFTTDSYVVDPIFFPGGNIGKIAVCGTVNDLAVSGATPKYISAAFILEEGLPMKDLEKIVADMAEEAKKANVLIVTGDTKVVNKGQCDKVFINTAGIGVFEKNHEHISSGEKIETGDKIIINGSIAQHGMAVMAVRNFGNFKTEIQTDCACLNHLIHEILDSGARIKFMRDATRGGLATVLCEIARNKNLGVEINEEKVPVDENVRGMCELLGFDPFYVANEGKLVMVVHPEDVDKVMQIMNNNPFGKEAAVIGELVNEHKGKAVLETSIGGKRIIDMLAGEQLPRIC
ncbi:MAG: hydrogenase expression/formation protein HypE [Bacteroidota bacterium]